jgi:hypothetical protein
MDVSMVDGKLVFTPEDDHDRQQLESWHSLVVRTPAYAVSFVDRHQRALILEAGSGECRSKPEEQIFERPLPELPAA